MTAPHITPFIVDQTRRGGAGSGSRHGFNIMQGSGPRWKTDPQLAQPSLAQVVAVPKQEIAPPPMRLGDLGYGLMAAPDLSKEQITAIQTAAGPIIQAIRTELEGLKMEGQMVSPESLRENPDQYKSANELGLYFTPQEMRTQVVVDTKALQAEASRILTGAISSYLTDPQHAVLSTVVDDSKALVAYIQQFDVAPITGAKSKLSDDEVKQRLGDIRNSIQNAEKMIVSTEAPSVPVEEQPGGSTIGTIIALAVLAGVGWYIYEQL